MNRLSGFWFEPDRSSIRRFVPLTDAGYDDVRVVLVATERVEFLTLICSVQRRDERDSVNFCCIPLSRLKANI